MARAATDPRVIDRFAELVGGLGCTQHEAARAVGISERHGERLLTRPEVRARVEESRTRDDQTGLSADVHSVLEDLLTAVDDHGAPAHGLRVKGAELLLKYKEEFDSIDPDDSLEEQLPPGVERVEFLVFPYDPSWDDPEWSDPAGWLIETPKEFAERFVEMVESGSYRGAAPGVESMRRALLDSARIAAEQQLRLRERGRESGGRNRRLSRCEAAPTSGLRAKA